MHAENLTKTKNATCYTTAAETLKSDNRSESKSHHTRGQTSKIIPNVFTRLELKRMERHTTQDIYWDYRARKSDTHAHTVSHSISGEHSWEENSDQIKTQVFQPLNSNLSGPSHWNYMGLCGCFDAVALCAYIGRTLKLTAASGWHGGTWWTAVSDALGVRVEEDSQTLNKHIIPAKISVICLNDINTHVDHQLSLLSNQITSAPEKGPNWLAAPLQQAEHMTAPGKCHLVLAECVFSLSAPPTTCCLSTSWTLQNESVSSVPHSLQGDKGTMSACQLLTIKHKYCHAPAGDEDEKEHF